MWKLNKAGVFAILMSVSAVTAFILPASWTNWLRAPFQPLALVQLPFASASRAVGEQIGEIGAEGTPSERELQAEIEALSRQVGHQELEIAAQQELLDDLSDLTSRAGDALATIVLAPVAAYDSDRRRETLQIVLTERSRPYVRSGQWVAAGTSGPATRAGLAQQWLIGRVDQVQTRLATVQLITDPGFMAGVFLARPGPDGSWELDEKPCRLQGLPEPGRMLIDQAERDYAREGFEIVVAPSSERLPLAMSIGRLVNSVARSDSPQHVDLRVAPWGEISRLRYVYVLIPAGDRVRAEAG